MDVCTAYLNGELEEEIYMRQPENFVSKENPGLVLKLNKSIYGLKQSGRSWNKKLDNVLKEAGFEQCISESCLYKKHIQCNLCLVAVYVDDILICCKNKNDLLHVKQMMNDNFDFSNFLFT